MIARGILSASVFLVLCAAASAEEVRPARPPKEKLSFGVRKDIREIPEGRRVILDEDSYPREPARIVEGPTVVRKGAGCSVRFALDKPDDVLVRVVGPGGETVRNLACGVLGWNAPDPMKPDALVQEIIWDGRDSAGKPAPAGCRVRLSLGLRPRFDRFVAYDPEQVLPKLCALEVDAQGRVYVGLHTARRGDNHLVRYDREGNFVENCFPPNPNLLKGKLEDMLRHVTYVDGKAVPSKRWLRWPHFGYKNKYGAGNLDTKFDEDSRHHWFPIRMDSDGRAFMLDAGAAMDEIHGAWAENSESKAVGVRRLIEGDAKSKVRLMQAELDPFWFLDYYCTGHGPWTIAAGGRVYIVRGNNPGAVIGGQVVPVAILKASWPDLKALSDFEYNGEEKLAEKRHFLESPKVRGKPPLFGMLVDIAGDAEGNLYVVDQPTPKKGEAFAPAELKVFAANGKLLSVLREYELGGRKIPLGSVYGVRVAAGALYVVSRFDPVLEKKELKEWRGGRLVKFSLGNGAALAALWEVPLSGSVHLVAVDEKADPPLVWVGNGNGPATLTRVADKGAAPGEVKHFGKGLRQGVIAEPWAIALDGGQGIFVYDYARGRIVRTNDDGSDWRESEPLPGNQTALCCDRKRDLLYVSQGALTTRLKGDLQADMASSGKPFRITGSALGAVDGDGNVLVGSGIGRYVKPAGEVPGPAGDGAEGKIGMVMVHDLQGAPKRRACVTWHPPAGVAMDSRGAVYVSDICVSKIGENETAGWMRGGKPIPCDSEVVYVVKFPPEGGTRLSESELWAHRGASPQTTGDCVCSAGTNCLVVDDSDRVFATDFMKYHVKVLDTAGNLITRIGTYGNADCRGPGSKFPDPEIAFWWLHSIDARGDFLYASDRDLRRIVKVRMDYRETQETAVP